MSVIQWPIRAEVHGEMWKDSAWSFTELDWSDAIKTKKSTQAFLTQIVIFLL